MNMKQMLLICVYIMHVVIVVHMVFVCVYVSASGSAPLSTFKHQLISSGKHC